MTTAAKLNRNSRKQLAQPDAYYTGPSLLLEIGHKLSWRYPQDQANELKKLFVAAHANNGWVPTQVRFRGSLTNAMGWLKHEKLLKKVKVGSKHGVPWLTADGRPVVSSYEHRLTRAGMKLAKEILDAQSAE